MLPSYYQQLKLIIIELLALSRDAIHIHVGFLALLLMLVFSRKKLHQWTVLIAPFVLSLLMECLDFWDDYLHLGRVNVAASLHDLLNTNLIPILLVIWARFERRRNGLVNS